MTEYFLYFLICIEKRLIFMYTMNKGNLPESQILVKIHYLFGSAGMYVQNTAHKELYMNNRIIKEVFL